MEFTAEELKILERLISLEKERNLINVQYVKKLVALADKLGVDIDSARKFRDLVFNKMAND